VTSLSIAERDRVPRRTHFGAAGTQTRYAAIKACSINSRQRRADSSTVAAAPSVDRPRSTDTPASDVVAPRRGPHQYTWPIVAARCCSASTDGPLDARITLVATSRYGRCGGMSIVTLRCCAAATDAMTLS